MEISISSTMKIWHCSMWKKKKIAEFGNDSLLIQMMIFGADFLSFILFHGKVNATVNACDHLLYKMMLL